MCTIIRSEQVNYPLIATEDIEVVKCCNATEDRSIVKSLFQDMVYYSGHLCEAEFSFDRDTYNGLVSDHPEDNYRNSLEKDNIPATFVITGFHSYESLERAKIGIEDRLFQYSSSCCLFIIPRGALYYKNEVGNIVSNKIIFKEIIK